MTSVSLQLSILCFAPFTSKNFLSTNRCYDYLDFEVGTTLRSIMTFCLLQAYIHLCKQANQNDCKLALFINIVSVNH